MVKTVKPGEIMEQRFIRNMPALSEGEQSLLREKRAVIIGCGGLGGYAAELLARAGVGALTLCDGDRFDESNLNRQVLALPGNLGANKALAAAERVKAIDEGIALCVFPEFFAVENAEKILSGADIVIDALDNAASRLYLESECARRGLWLVHGAVEGFHMQLCAVEPGSGVLARLYAGVPERQGKCALAPTAAVCAGMQCAEALKLLCGRESGLNGKLLVGDMESMEFDTFLL